MHNKLIDLWSKNKPVINAWLSLPNSFTAEAFGKMGWDSITIDMQHGQKHLLSSTSIRGFVVTSLDSPRANIKE